MKPKGGLVVAAAIVLASCSQAVAPRREPAASTPGPSATVPAAAPSLETIPAATNAASTPNASAPEKATPSPKPVPTQDGGETAADAFIAIDSAYVKTYTALSSKVPASWTFVEAQSYYRGLTGVVKAFKDGLSPMTFPSGVMPGVRTLRKRVSDFVSLMDNLAATRDEDAGWLIVDRIQTADTATDAAREVVAESLGFSYDVAEVPAATSRPPGPPRAIATPEPTQVVIATETPTVRVTPTPTATPRPPSMFPVGFVAASEAINHLSQVVTVCGTVASTKYAVGSLGSPTFLDLDRPYPANVFTILIWPEHRASFGGAPERLFLGSRVCITGPVSVNKGVAQIVSTGGDVTVYD